jgi:hypothetical protein
MSLTGTTLADDLAADPIFARVGASNGTLIPGTDFAVGVVPAIVSATATGLLSADFETARWTPIVVTLFVPFGYQALMLTTAELGDSSHWHCAYRGDLGFSPLYEDLSLVVSSVAANGGTNITISLLPLGGWVSSPAITPGLFLEAH